ncbi:SDR family oxidoreductase [Phytoactinopolyspora sp. XMNu-373]|uniref:SDR family oxidoreductase n=2 Tax=Phytoactinopolyspora mesophila TaxID=2650750 RepID=A0A7K3M7K4_9ACTN|nr:SDR family oxidoreductase [Phytoactinopolyspora mesophila]
MSPRPRDEMADYVGRGLLEGRTALITGGDSGIGRAVAVAFAKEGADVSIAYLEETDDARHTIDLISDAGRDSLGMPGDMSHAEHCRDVVARTAAEFGRIDILVNNLAYQRPQKSLEAIDDEQWDRTFRTNVYSYFWVTKAALKHIPEGGSIINTSSVNGLRGNSSLIDYAATKGAINAFTYSLAQSLVDRRIRVNCVAPGPVWTPLIPSTLPAESVQRFGEDTPMGHTSHPDDIAPSYVFFASERLSGYYSGEILAPTGGEITAGCRP